MYLAIAPTIIIQMALARSEDFISENLIQAPMDPNNKGEI